MTDAPLPLPVGFTWGYVTGRVIAAIADTIDDEDRIPEARGVQGTVTFTPANRVPRNGDVLAIYRSESRSMDTEGYLLNAHNERQPIALLTGAYTVSFNLLGGGSLNNFPILVTEDHTLENPLILSHAAPPAPPTGTTTLMALPSGAFNGAFLGYQNGDPVWAVPAGGGEGGASDWNTLLNRPAVIAAGATQTEARTAIGAASQTEVDDLTVTTEDQAITLTALGTSVSDLEQDANSFDGRITALEVGFPLVPITQAEYDALDPVDPNLFYAITD